MPSELLNIDTFYQEKMQDGWTRSVSTGNSLIPEDEQEPDAKKEEKDKQEENENVLSCDTGVLVKFDPKIELPEIKQFLTNPSADEDPENGSDSQMQQTKITGILAPLVQIGTTPIPFSCVSYLELSDNPYPKVYLEVVDRFDLVKTFDKPTKDNKLQIQIIPEFENAYKKINLTFWITSLRFEDSNIYISAVYNIPKFHDNVLHAYGELSTYEFCEQIAKDLELGFASNLEETNDKRWIYIPNEKVYDGLSRECELGGGEKQILNWWIDWWNYLNFVDVYERNETIDKDIKVWAMTHKYPETEAVQNSDPVLMEAMITNNSLFRNYQLYVSEYSDEFSSAKVTDKIIETYKINDMEEDNFIIRDGDVNNDIFTQYEYAGENFGEYKYLKQRYCREMWQSKMKNSVIRVSLRQPCLSLMKGHKVNFYWYTVNDFTKDIKDSDEVQSNIPLPIDREINEAKGEDPDKQDDEMILDHQVSGQYYIMDTIITYDYNGGRYSWGHDLVLSRPEDQKEYFDWDSVNIENE